MTFLRLLPIATLVLFSAGCNPDDRVDGDNPRHTDSDDYEQDAYDAERGEEGTVPEPLSTDDAVPAREALGDTLSGE